MNKYLIAVFCCTTMQLNAQTKPVTFQQHPEAHKIDVRIGGAYFTSFIFPPDLEKPVLYPLQSAKGITITRGYPLQPREQERTDHPHHVGVWLNYESVNGLDFWNNSSHIPANKKAAYGWIRKVKLANIIPGKSTGILAYTANWENQAQHPLLKETTAFTFSGNTNWRIIDRTTTLTAIKDTVWFKDVKDGFLGIRVTKELELPSDKPTEFADVHGNITKVSPSANGANGNYLSSTGKTGNDVWGTRAAWCMLYGTKEKIPVAVTIIDHPKNPGYPTYWHARDYGLFAANPLGQQVFSKGTESLNLSLAPGQSVTFRYRIIISDTINPDTNSLNQQAAQFSQLP